MHDTGSPSIDAAADEIASALDRILRDPLFEGAPHLSAFLRFVVEAKLAGKDSSIKGYTIAVEALGRRADFDPQFDSIVRVEAGRLRDRLDLYYAGSGAEEAIEIGIPKGSYVPVFKWRPAARPGFAPRADAGGFRWRAQHWCLGAVVAALLIGTIGLEFYYAVLGAKLQSSEHEVPTRTAVTRPERWHDPIIAVDPTIGPDNSASTLVAHDIARRLTAALAASDDVAVAAAPVTVSRDGVAPSPASSLDYRLRSFVVYEAAGAADYVFELIKTADDTVVWTRKFDHIPLDADNAAPVTAMIKTVVTLLVQPYGIIFAEQRHRATRRDGDDDIAECVNRAYAALRKPSTTTFQTAESCLDIVTAANPTDATPRSLAALVYRDEYRFGNGEPAQLARSLERAVSAARDAIRLKPASARAQAVLADILLTSGHIDDALETIRRAIELNPYDATLDFYRGMILIFSGQFAEGDKALDSFFALAPAPPQRTYFGGFVAAYVRGDMADAARHARQLRRTEYPLGYLADALVGTAERDRAKTVEALALLDALQPNWRRDPMQELAKHLPMPSMRDRFLAALIAAREFAAR